MVCEVVQGSLVGMNKAYFSKRQECACETIEQAFGVLQCKFQVLTQPFNNGQFEAFMI